METATHDRDLGDETNEQTSYERVLARLESMPKQGESYAHLGRVGWANPIREDTGPILRALVFAARPRRVLEFGTAHGLSMLYIGGAAPEADCHTIEWDQQRALEAEANIHQAGLNAVVHQGDAMKILDQLTGQFDFVFMDANKDGYLEQITKLLANGMLHPDGATIVADNVIDRQKECQDFLDFMKEYPHEILKTECGLLVARM